MGESTIHLSIRGLTQTLFGENISIGFSKLLEDHFTSSKVCFRLSQDYGLGRWVLKDFLTEKQGADLFEAWLGSVYEELEMWGDDAQERIEEFLKALLEIRYRRLRPFMVGPRMLNCVFSGKNEAQERNVVSSEVWYPDHEVFKACKLALPQFEKRRVGFMATANWIDKQGNEICFEVFDGDQGRAEDLARRLFPSGANAGTYLAVVF